MRLGALLYAFGGDNPVGWRHPSTAGWGPNDIGYTIELARIAERGKLDLLFFADMAAVPDGPPSALARGVAKAARIDPLVTITALAAATSHIGVAATASTSYWEPYNLARLLASIDHVSGGRAGWNVVTSDRNEVARNFGDDGLRPREERYARAAEFVDVVLGLWDSWEEDALVVDRAGGRFLDPELVHRLDHDGDHFRVEGPLNVSRTPQGRPVIAEAGSSEPGRRLAAATADVVFSAFSDVAAARAFADDIRDRAAVLGRSPDEIAILESLTVTVAATEDEARAKARWLRENTPIEVGLWSMTEHLGADLSHLPLDEPVPRDALPTEAPGSQGLFDALVTFISEGSTLRECVRRFAEVRSGSGIVGSAEQVADHMQARFEAGANDGFMLQFPQLPTDLSDVTDHLVPELQRRGLFRTEYAGTTLRENLGIDVPANRWTRVPTA
jgi:FMN-dependent oxidoreductase (nitrilotriacetate monooxygenase family)